jgi:translation initiation factor IF-2
VVNKPINPVNPINKEESPAAAEAQPIELPHALSVRNLADLLKVGAIDIIKQLMRKGVMANINQTIEYEVAAAIATDSGYKPRLKPRAAEKAASVVKEIKKQLKAEEAGRLKPRPPVVTIMGHVDHGKTKLLDAIRQTNVAATEAGGITQHIGAYQVEFQGQKITFLDTPGHEAFTAMRARGAQATDICVLVVAADDGVMPQTLEAINHARAAGVPIVVAINKIDKPGANPDMVKQQLADAGLIVEEWGGDVVCVHTSAKEKKGISDLLENILAVAEMEELKANPALPAVGVVIEAKMDKTKGSLATVLVHNGTLKVGDVVVVGTIWGKVKAMFNDAGKHVRKAEPATPAEILGLSSVPQVGDPLTVVADEREAGALAQKRLGEKKKQEAKAAVRLSSLFDQISAGKVKELNLILKTDVQGSLEPIRSSLEQLSTEVVKVRMIHSGSGNVTESDVMLAIASRAIIVGFTTGVETGARRLADVEGVDIRSYNVIYDLIDDVGKALTGMLEPTRVEVIDGHAEVRAIFPAGKKEKAAGVYVTEGKVTRSASIRVLRQGEKVYESVVSSLRRFKEDVREVASGYDGGVGVQGFSDFAIGDILEFFHIEERK